MQHDETLQQSSYYHAIVTYSVATLRFEDASRQLTWPHCFGSCTCNPSASCQDATRTVTNNTKELSVVGIGVTSMGFAVQVNGIEGIAKRYRRDITLHLPGSELMARELDVYLRAERASQRVPQYMRRIVRLLGYGIDAPDCVQGKLGPYFIITERCHFTLYDMFMSWYRYVTARGCETGNDAIGCETDLDRVYPPKLLAEIFKQLCEAMKFIVSDLGFAHRDINQTNAGIVVYHRDPKSNTIGDPWSNAEYNVALAGEVSPTWEQLKSWYSSSSTHFQCKLFDMGSLRHQDAHLAGNISPRGSVLKSPPECISSLLAGNIMCGQKSDVWTVAWVLYDGVYGKMLGEWHTLKANNVMRKIRKGKVPPLPSTLDHCTWDPRWLAMVQRMWTKDITERPTWEEVLQMINDCLVQL